MLFMHRRHLGMHIVVNISLTIIVIDTLLEMSSRVLQHGSPIFFFKKSLYLILNCAEVILVYILGSLSCSLLEKCSFFLQTTKKYRTLF